MLLLSQRRLLVVLLLSGLNLLLVLPSAKSLATPNSNNTPSSSSISSSSSSSSSSGITSTSPTSKSPWAPATWIITLELGTEDNGSRIVTPITVQVESTSLPSNKNEMDPFIGPGASSLVPQTTGTYISLKGEQTLQLSTGGWTLEFPPGGGGKNKGLATQVRMWMDLESNVERNNVAFEKGQRLYFAAKAWREDDYEFGLRRMKPIHQAYKRAQQVLNEKLSHESGDRRLDGKDAMETLQAYGDMTQLVLDRDVKRQEWLQALEKYPPVDGSISIDNDDGDYDDNNRNRKEEDLPEGPWPGAEEWMTLSNQNNPILVALPTKLPLMGQEYQQVGQWKAAPVLSEEDYELVSIEEDDDEEKDE
jgi:hypothetical protein